MFKHTTDLVDHISREKVQSKCQWLTESCIIVCQPHIIRIGKKNDNIILASAPFAVNFYPTFVTFKVSQRQTKADKSSKQINKQTQHKVMQIHMPEIWTQIRTSQRDPEKGNEGKSEHLKGGSREHVG